MTKALLVMEVTVDGRLNEPYERLVRAVGEALVAKGLDKKVTGITGVGGSAAENVRAIIEEST